MSLLASPRIANSSLLRQPSSSSVERQISCPLSQAGASCFCQCVRYQMHMHRASGAHEHPIRSPPLSAARDLSRGRSRDLPVLKLKATRAKSACDRGRGRSCNGQGLHQAREGRQSPSHNLSRSNIEHDGLRRDVFVRAAKSATYSEDPWQEDAARHDVLESMEEVSPEPALERLSTRFIFPPEGESI